MSKEEGLFSISASIIMVLLFLYMFFAALIEKYHIPIGHEASLLVIIGFAVSYVAFLMGHHDFNMIMTFDHNFFFYFVLPPIIFASGFNMKRKEFFKNIGNILLFGLLSTVLQFVVFTFLTWAVGTMDIFWKYSSDTGIYEKFTLSLTEIMLLCSLLVCSDAVAAISIIRYDEQPKLFSIIFGEGVTNDAVGLILFNTVQSMVEEPDFELNAYTPFKVTLDFVKLGIFSIIIGFLIAALSSLVLKKCRFLTVNPVIEVNIVFIFGYLSYSVAEMLHFSGIISLLIAGVVMAKYTWYNLSPQSRQVTSIAFQVIAYAVEAFVFGYLGISFFSYISMDWSWQFFITMLIITVLGRFLCTIGLTKLCDIFGYNSGIPMKELVFISYAGVIRGAVAFALVLRIDEGI